MRPGIDPESKKLWRQAGITGAVGIEIAVAIAIGYFGGQYLDNRFQTGPWLTVVGFGAGVGASVKALVRVVRQYQRDNPPEDEGQNTPQPPADPGAKP